MDEEAPRRRRRAEDRQVHREIEKSLKPKKRTMDRFEAGLTPRKGPEGCARATPRSHYHGTATTLGEEAPSPGVAGHKAGVDAVRAVIEVFAEEGSRPTLFAFLQRELAASGGRSQRADELLSRGPAPRGAQARRERHPPAHHRRSHAFPSGVAGGHAEAEAATAGTCFLQVAANYGGQWDRSGCTAPGARGSVAAPGGDDTCRAVPGLPGDRRPAAARPAHPHRRRRVSHQQFPSLRWPTPSCIRPVLARLQARGDAGCSGGISPSASAACKTSEQAEAEARPSALKQRSSRRWCFAHRAGVVFPFPKGLGVLRPVHRRAVVSLNWEWRVWPAEVAQ